MADLQSIQPYAGLTVTGVVNSVFTIQFKDDLAQAEWQPLGRVTLTSSPSIWFDSSRPVSGQRFYRTVVEGIQISVLDQPQDRALSPGSDTTFSVSASGTPPYYFQWLRNGAILPDATNQTLTLTNVQQANSGSYSVLISNAFGSVMSSPAVLKIMNSSVQDFVITVGTGLSCNIGAGTLAFNDGSEMAVPSNSLALQASSTNYIALDLFTLKPHAYRLAQDRGSVFLGAVVTSQNGILSIQQFASPAIPKSRLAAVRRKLAAGLPITVFVLGDSLSLGTTPGNTNSWHVILCNPGWVSNSASLGTTNITVRNASVGGTVSRWGMVCLANIISRDDASGAIGHINMGISRDAVRNAYATNRTAEYIGPSTWLSPVPDLTIVSFGANATKTDTEEFAYLETIVRKLRRAGSEVLLWSENDRISNPDSFQNAWHASYARIADQHGAEFIDWHSRCEEVNSLLGTNTYYDTIHQNLAGQLAMAQAFKSVLCRPQDSEVIPPNDTRLLLNVSSNWFPNACEVEFPENAGPATQSTVTYSDRCPSIALMGKTRGIGATAQPANTFFVGSFSRCEEVDLIYESTNGAVDVYSSTTHLMTNIALSDTTTGFKLQTVISIPQMRSNYPGYWSLENWGKFVPNGAWRFRSAGSGQLNIEGIAAYNFEGYTIATAEMQLQGTWREEASGYDAGGLWKCTDSTNAAVTIPFTGNGLIVYLQSWQATAKITAYVDDAIVMHDIDLFVPATSQLIYPVQLWPNSQQGTPFSDNWANNYGKHIARIEMSGSLNPAAIEPKEGNHRMAVYGAFAVDAR